MVEVNILRVVGYCRVSTEDQTENTSLEDQQKKIEAYAISQGWIMDRLFIEQGSGSNVEGRPTYREMVSYAKANGIQAVVVNAADRIHRSLKNLLVMIEDDFEPNGIAFVSVSQKFDTSTAQGMLFLQMVGSFAEFERKQINTRTKSGRLATAKAGKLAGGSVPYGYDIVNGDLVVNQAEAAMVKRIFRDAVGGMSLQKITDSLTSDGVMTKGGKPWTKQSVAYILHNEVYVGVMTYNGDQEQNHIRVEGQHEAIVSKVTYGKAQAQLAKRTK